MCPNVENLKIVQATISQKCISQPRRGRIPRRIAGKLCDLYTHFPTGENITESAWELDELNEAIRKRKRNKAPGPKKIDCTAFTVAQYNNISTVRKTFVRSIRLKEDLGCRFVRVDGLCSALGLEPAFRRSFGLGVGFKVPVQV